MAWLRASNVINSHNIGPWYAGPCLAVDEFHQSMMTSSNGNIFRVTGPFVRGIHRSPVNYPHKGQWSGALRFSFICAWTKAWVNRREAGDLRRHLAHYDVTVMRRCRFDITPLRSFKTCQPVTGYCSGSLEPESSCHDRDWIMELPMEADILTFTGILTPEDASVASCFPFDITISLSWFPLLSMPPLHSAIP